MAVKGAWKVVSRISLGLVLVLVWAWMYLKADQLFPINTEQWKDIIQTYIIFASIIFSFNVATERPLFEAKFIKAFPKFLIGAGITLVVLFLFGLTFKGDALPSIASAISNVGLGVILLHAFFVATLEEKVFRGWMANELKSRKIRRSIVWIITSVVFAFFHYTVSGEILTLWIYIPLGLLFMWVKERFSPKTDMANSGVHFAWNFFVLGFMS